MPFLESLGGAAIIGGASSLLGNLFGASSTRKTNQTNLAINMMNNEFNGRMMQKQMDYNTMMWNKQNAYNTPSAQRQRLESAGLNPFMMLNGGSVGNAQAVGSTSAASAAPSAPQQAFHPDFSGIPQSILMAKQGANIDADTESKVIDNQTRALKNMQEVVNLIAESKNKAIKNKLSLVQLSYADQLAMVQIQNERAQTQNLIREGLLMDKELAIFDERTRLEISQLSADILLTSAQARKTKQETVHEIQKMIETTVRTSGQRISNDVAKRTANSIVEKAYRDSAPQTMWSTITNGYRDLSNNVKGLFK